MGASAEHSVNAAFAHFHLPRDRGERKTSLPELFNFVAVTDYFGGGHLCDPPSELARARLSCAQKA